jgi:membrane protein required for colicin V production
LRPIFSAAGQRGFRALPPELTATIDRLKHEQRI